MDCSLCILLTPLLQLGTSNIDEVTNDMSVQTPDSLSASTPWKSKLRSIVTTKRKNIAHRRKKIKSEKQTNALQNLTKAQKSTKAFQLLEGAITPELLTFSKKQVSLSSVKKKGRRYDDSYKGMALRLYHISGKAYRCLAKLLKLPSKKTLTNLVSNVSSGCSFTDKSLYVLWQRVEQVPLGSRFCSLIMDEMSLKSHLHYDEKNDSIIGFEDFGDKETSGAIAKSALVLMARGILQNWKQPIAYYFVNESYDRLHFKEIVTEAIMHLENMGLSAISLVSDQGSEFASFFAYMGVSEEEPVFEINGKKYFVLYDPPHLLKSVRNNLMKYYFDFGNKGAKWAHIEEFVQKDQKITTRLAPKLTEKHLHPNGFSNMKVKHSSQIFSHTLSAAINTCVYLQALPGDAISTDQLIKHFDTLFDCCNSISFKDSKKCRCPLTLQSPHIGELINAFAFIKSLTVVEPTSKED